MKLPPVNWSATALCLIAAGFTLQALDLQPHGPAAAAAGLAAAAAVQLHRLIQRHTGPSLAIPAILSLTLAAGLQTYAAIVQPQWQIAPASFAAALPGAIIASRKLNRPTPGGAVWRRQSRSTTGARNSEAASPASMGAPRFIPGARAPSTPRCRGLAPARRDNGRRPTPRRQRSPPVLLAATSTERRPPTPGPAFPQSPSSVPTQSPQHERRHHEDHEHR